MWNTLSNQTVKYWMKVAMKKNRENKILKSVEKLQYIFDILLCGQFMP